MKEHSTAHLLRIHHRPLFTLLMEQRQKVNGNNARLHMWESDFTFSGNGFQEINNCSRSYSFQGNFESTWVSESLCVYLLFTLRFNTNLNETILKKYRNLKKEEKRQHDISWYLLHTNLLLDFKKYFAFTKHVCFSSFCDFIFLFCSILLWADDSISIMNIMEVIPH